MKELFIPYRPQKKTLAVIDHANLIIGEYAARGFKLTLRQLYYQFVARGLLEENTMAQYKRLGKIIRDARDGGMIDWAAIVDRTREVNTHPSWDSPADIIEAAARSYQEDLWNDQLYQPEVWVEKEAAIGVIEGVCTELRVPYFAHRGNNSQTLQYEAGKRFADYLDQGLIPVVLHLADHDPNGIDMTRDNRERLALYARAPIEVHRIGLNIDQVRRYNPPPSIAKDTDTRTPDYVANYGDECWELDALPPDVVADLIRDGIEPMIDREDWEASKRSEGRGRELLDAVADNWTKVEEFVAEDFCPE